MTGVFGRGSLGQGAVCVSSSPLLVSEAPPVAFLGSGVRGQGRRRRRNTRTSPKHPSSTAPPHIPASSLPRRYTPPLTWPPTTAPLPRLRHNARQRPRRGKPEFLSRHKSSRGSHARRAPYARVHAGAPGRVLRVPHGPPAGREQVRFEDGREEWPNPSRFLPLSLARAPVPCPRKGQ